MWMFGHRFSVKHSCLGHSCLPHGDWENPQKKGFWARRQCISDRQQLSLLHSDLTVRSQLTLKAVLNLALWLKSSCVGVAISTAINNIWEQFTSQWFLCNKESVRVISRLFLWGQKLHLFCLPPCTGTVSGPHWKQGNICWTNKKLITA